MSVPQVKIYTVSKGYTCFLIPAALILFTYGTLMPILTDQQIERSFVTTFITVYLWHRFLTLPYKILIYENEKIEFRRLIKSFTITANDVLSVKEASFMNGMYVKHSRGKTKISSLFTNLTELKGKFRSYANRTVLKET